MDCSYCKGFEGYYKGYTGNAWGYSMGEREEERDMADGFGCLIGDSVQAFSTFF